MAEDIKKNQFHPDTIEKAREDFVIRKAEIKEKVERTLKLGQKCLANPDFAKYRENYEALESVMVDTWIKLVEPDPVRYTIISRGMALQLHQLRLLLEGVTKDASKKV